MYYPVVVHFVLRFIAYESLRASTTLSPARLTVSIALTAAYLFTFLPVRVNCHTMTTLFNAWAGNTVQLMMSLSVKAIVMTMLFHPVTV